VIVSRSHGFIFLRPPRCGSSSVQQSLAMACEGGDSISEIWLTDDQVDQFQGGDIACLGGGLLPDGLPLGAFRYSLNYPPNFSHQLPSVVRSEFPDEWRDFTTVSIVRNPWSAMASRALFMRRVNGRYGSTPVARIIVNMLNGRRKPTGWPGPREPYWWPWWASEIPYREPVDVLLRFEHLERDFFAFCTRLGFVTTLLRLRETPKSSYVPLYDDTARVLVAERFSGMIERHGYRFEDC